jgi:ATP-dependent RNA helicase RhlE
LKFSEFNLCSELQDGLEAMGFETPTEIQEKAIPLILQGKDMIGCAQTGTGKTAAFLLPIMHQIETNRKEGINAVIIAPTRELALQIDQQLEGFAYFTTVSSFAVYGGGDGAGFDQQKKALTKGTDIIIATPGKLISHLNLGYVKFDNVQHLILDEADRMLDMGFFDDIMRILSFMPKKRQNLLFSATMPPKIRDLSKRILTDPEQINISLSKPAEGVLQAAYMVYDKQKVGLISHLLKGKEEEYKSVIVFSSTKSNVKRITATLKKNGFSAQEIHSDLNQEEREEALRLFKNRRVQITVATDILARGIDIDEISLVINYDVPGDGEDYVHRVGRTARAASTGVAITFITEDDQSKFHQIEQLIETDVKKLPLPAELGEGPVYNPRKRSFGNKKKGGYRGNKKRHFHKGGNNKGKGGGFKKRN